MKALIGFIILTLVGSLAILSARGAFHIQLATAAPSTTVKAPVAAPVRPITPTPSVAPGTSVSPTAPNQSVAPTAPAAPVAPIAPNQAFGMSNTMFNPTNRAPVQPGVTNVMPKTNFPPGTTNLIPVPTNSTPGITNVLPNGTNNPPPR